MKFFNETKIRRGLKFGVIIFAAFVVVVLFLSNLYSYLEKKKQEKIIKEMQQPYLEDTYGGKTPEETLELFIQALKEGNIDLASKYFILEKQEEWRDLLNKIQTNNHLENMVNDLEKEKEEKYINDNKIQFIIRTESGQLGAQINFVKYPANIWKVTGI